MIIELNKSSEPLIQDTVVFDISAYAGDMDYSQGFQLKVDPKDFVKTYLELMFVKEQFQNGRGGHDYYNQYTYFGQDEDDLEESEDGAGLDGYWTWMSPEFCDTEYLGSSEYGNNHTISSINVTYYNNEGIKFDVIVSGLDEVKQAIIAFNRARIDPTSYRYPYKIPYDQYRSEAIEALKEMTEQYAWLLDYFYEVNE